MPEKDSRDRCYALTLWGGASNSIFTLSFVASTFQEGLNKTKLKKSGELCCANAKVKVTYSECVTKQHDEVIVEIFRVKLAIDPEESVNPSVLVLSC